MKLESDDLVSALIRLFAILGVFGPHWPTHLVQESLEEAENRCEEHGRPRAWEIARVYLDYHLEHRFRLEIPDF